MLALGVFMIGIAGIVTMQLAARRTRVSANDLSLATNIAASTLDGLETQDFDGLATTTDWYDRQGGQLGTADGAFFTVVTTVTADPTTPGELEDATAEVSWSVDGRPHGITLRTMVTR